MLMKPKHPYTQLLRDSIPEADPHKKWKERLLFLIANMRNISGRGVSLPGDVLWLWKNVKKKYPGKFWSVLIVLVKCHQYSGESKVRFICNVSYKTCLIRRNEKMLGVCYYPEHWSKEHQITSDIPRMRELGIQWVKSGSLPGV